MSNEPFSVAAVIAAYNVARYLPDLLASLESQTLDIRQIQLIFVDDGSTDDTLSILRAWSIDRESHVTVISQANAWVAEARNRGLKEVTADWVTFADADDVFDKDYFNEVQKFITTHGDKGVSLLETLQLRLTDAGKISNTHPLRGKFARRSRIVDLRIDPVIQLSVNSAFFRTETIRAVGLTFDDRVRPVFEDAHFVSRYLLLSQSNVVGLVASARYLYRTRSDGTSLMQNHFDQVTKYTSVLRFGHVDLLELARDMGGVPRWLENTILYDVFWYFKNERAIESLSATAPPHVFPEFHELIGRIAALLSAESIKTFDIMGVEQAIRVALMSGYRDQPVRPSHVTLNKVDENRQQVQLVYWFSGDLPEEIFTADGLAVEPRYDTIQDYVFYGRTGIRRRIVWLDRAQTTTISIDGTVTPIRTDDPLGPVHSLTSRQINPTIMRQRRRPVRTYDNPDQPLQDYLRGKIGAWRRKRRESRKPAKRFDKKLARSIHSTRARSRYSHAWVFMDRNTDANDNAEHLYRHVARTHPEINSWFVLDRSSRDWARLEAEGFRLVAYKTREWYELLLHAVNLASSHIDQYVVDPWDKNRYGAPRFRFTFLQHGVTNYDISRWVNGKPVETFVVVTPQERKAIAGPGPYFFSGREVAQTGFPRHDELLRKRRSQSADARNLLVVMPTWRKKLAGPQVRGSNERAKNPEFMQSQFATEYQTLLRSDELRDLAAKTGHQLAFMPHPNIRPYLADFDLPSDVKILDFATDNVQDVLARAAVFITDFSSLAFDAAFIDVPVVYFHFDESSFFDGTHVGRRGDFDYQRDGFGPVAHDVTEVVGAIDTIASRQFVSDEVHLRRTAAAFLNRDEENCERVFRSMLSIMQKEPRPIDAEVVRA